MSGLLISPVYPPPFGTPLYWGDEGTGVLREAVMAYYDELLGKEKMSETQLLFVRAYVVYAINAPSWLERDPGADLDKSLVITALRMSAAKMTTVADVKALLDAAWRLADLDLL